MDRFSKDETKNEKKSKNDFLPSKRKKRLKSKIINLNKIKITPHRSKRKTRTKILPIINRNLQLLTRKPKHSINSPDDLKITKANYPILSPASVEW